MDGRAAIVGGGIGGLAAAIGLSRAGWQVTVFERAAGPTGAGTALGLWPQALQALDALGLGDAVRRLGTPQVSGALLRPDGSRIAKLNVDVLRRRTGDPVYLLSRPALLDLLAGAAPEGALHWGTTVETVPTGYDAVIGADGLASGVRTALFGAGYRPRYTGATAWRGCVEGMATGEGSETWGRGKRFGITPQEGGRTNWYATVCAPEGEHRPGHEVDELRAQFAGWHAPIPEILSRVSEDTVLRHDLYYLHPQLPSFVRGNVALIGDAAHAMTPDLGRGACEALVDAVALARCLAEEPDVHKGLTRYDRERRRPAQRLAATSTWAGRVAQARRLTRLRDGAVRLALAVSPMR